MNRRVSLAASATLVIVAFAIWAQRKTGERSAPHPYCAAFVKGATLVVFPFNARAVTVPLPYVPALFGFSADGRSLYAARQYPDTIPGLFRIELRSGSTTAIPGSAALFDYSIAISKDESKIVVSGRFRAPDGEKCGLFELTTATGTIRRVPVPGNPDCDYLYAWHDLSLSPDAKRAVAFRKVEARPEILLIDLDQGTETSLGWGWRAAWSADGKWIAVLDLNSGITIIDAREPSRKRHFGGPDDQELTWSPDSRYLLLWKSCLPSLGYFGTLEALEVKSGKRETIRSSRCSVNLMTSGWVSDEVLR